MPSPRILPAVLPLLSARLLKSHASRVMQKPKYTPVTLPAELAPGPGSQGPHCKLPRAIQAIPGRRSRRMLQFSCSWWLAVQPPKPRRCPGHLRPGLLRASASLSLSRPASPSVAGAWLALRLCHYCGAQARHNTTPGRRSLQVTFPSPSFPRRLSSAAPWLSAAMARRNPTPPAHRSLLLEQPGL